MEYYKKTSPLIGYYYARGDLRSVNGLQDVDKVASDIAAALA
jgi:adenylate kinase